MVMLQLVHGYVMLMVELAQACAGDMSRLCWGHLLMHFLQ